MDTGKCVHCGSYSFILLSNDVQFGQAFVSVGNVTGSHSITISNLGKYSLK